MDIVARLLKVLHWIALIPFILLIFVILDESLFKLVCDPNIMISECYGRRTITAVLLLFGVPLYFIVFISRYIIFGRVGWFPWTPFRKD